MRLSKKFKRSAIKTASAEDLAEVLEVEGFVVEDGVGGFDPSSDGDPFGHADVGPTGDARVLFNGSKNERLETHGDERGNNMLSRRMPLVGRQEF